MTEMQLQACYRLQCTWQIRELDLEMVYKDMTMHCTQET